MINKELRFETSKGKLFMVENIPSILRQIPHDLCERIGLLSGLTEEQASEIVDSTQKGGFLKCYFDYTKGYYSNSLFTSLDSLHSLIKSKGWYLSNTWVNTPQTDGIYNHVETRTLHNPVIFKIK